MVDVVSVVAMSSGGSLQATPSAAQRVKNEERRTVNAFLMVYVDEGYLEPVSMQPLAYDKSAQHLAIS